MPFYVVGRSLPPSAAHMLLAGHIGFFACFHDISRTQSFQQNRHVIFPALVALKLLVSLISRLVACSARIDADKQTNKQTDTQNDYRNPCCACAPRVNYRKLCATPPCVHPMSTSRDISDQAFPALSNFYCVLHCVCGGRLAWERG